MVTAIDIMPPTLRADARRVLLTASCPAQIRFRQRTGAYSFPSRGEDGIQHRRRRHEYRRRADTAPEIPRRHHDGFDFWHLVHAQHLVSVEVLLLHLTVLQRDLAVKQVRDSVH